uniref:Uncharacterized protein n=1 Tax=Timema monikensis TaxID=170555 RepID=A0A7R9EKZ9_9NEOP|nr:unnamed protein product [Timema monikensis]
MVPIDLTQEYCKNKSEAIKKLIRNCFSVKPKDLPDELQDEVIELLNDSNFRVGNIVLSWEDPHDSVVYCLQTDGGNTIMCGTSHHCRTQLWDKRITRRGVQMYFVQGHRSSPVYSLAFDPLPCPYKATATKLSSEESGKLQSQ